MSTVTNPMAAPPGGAPAAPTATASGAPAPGAPAPVAPAPVAPATAAPSASASASNTLYLNIEGDLYTRKTELQQNYGGLTEDQIRKLMELYNKDGTFKGTIDLTEEDKKFIKNAFEKRIQNIDEQLKNNSQNILRLQPLRTVKTRLQDRLNAIEGTTAVAAPPTSTPTLNEATRKKLNDKLMTLLLRIGYAITHSKQIPPSFIEKWNNFLKSTDELTAASGPLNTTTNSVPEDKSFTLDKASFVKPIDKRPVYKTVTEYLQAMITVSDREAKFKTQIEETLDALYTYQFIQKSEKNAFNSKNTKRIEKMSPAVKKRIRTRFSSSMAIILQYYQTLLGRTEVYDTINTETFLNIFTPPLLRPTTAPSPYFSVQEGLRIIEGILENVYFKLSTNTDFGIYRINKTDSEKLIPLITFYTETTGGQSLSSEKMKENFKTQPFVWFQLGSKIVKQNPQVQVELTKLLGKPPTGTTGTPVRSTEDIKALSETFNNFIGDDATKATSVFMMVNSSFPIDATPSTFALLHTYGKDTTPDETSKIAMWNEAMGTIKGVSATSTIASFGTFTGIAPPGTVAVAAGPAPPPRLSDIGLTQWPPYTIQTHLSMPVFQCMTFLAAANQMSPANKQYQNLVLPP